MRDWITRMAYKRVAKQAIREEYKSKGFAGRLIKRLLRWTP